VGVLVGVNDLVGVLLGVLVLVGVLVGVLDGHGLHVNPWLQSLHSAPKVIIKLGLLLNAVTEPGT